MNTKDDLKALIIPGLNKKVEIFDDAEKAISELLEKYDDDKLSKTILISAVAHIVAEVVSRHTCCAYHAMEIWGEIGNAVIAGAMPGDKIEWESVNKPDDDDGFYVPPPIMKPTKPH